MLQHWGERDACTREYFLAYMRGRVPRYRASFSDVILGVLGVVVAMAQVWAVVAFTLRLLV